jgi:hypothetical protein
MDFYHESRRILARYTIEAPLPGAAVLLGRSALPVEYPSTPTRARLSLFKQAQRVEGKTSAGGSSTGFPPGLWSGATGDRPVGICPPNSSTCFRRCSLA